MPVNSLTLSCALWILSPTGRQTIGAVIAIAKTHVTWAISIAFPFAFSARVARDAQPLAVRLRTFRAHLASHETICSLRRCTT